MDVFQALGEPTRRSILEMLAHRGKLTASDIYESFQISRPAISQHLKILRETKLVSVEKRAQQRIYQINPTAIVELELWAKQMSALWDERFDALANVHEQEKNKFNK